MRWKGAILIFSIENELIKRINIVVGHYGSGKTTLSQNMAFAFAKAGRKVVIVDLDTVNPFFRTADLKKELQEAGIEVITPNFVNTAVDVPSLPSTIFSVFAQKEYTVIFDVGGDNVGATALSRYREYFMREQYDLFCVVNKNRMLIADPNDAKVMKDEIETSSRLKVTGLVNCTNLCDETSADTIISSFDYFNECAKIAEIPTLFTVAKEELVPKIERESGEPLFPIKIHTKKLF